MLRLLQSYGGITPKLGIGAKDAKSHVKSRVLTQNAGQKRGKEAVKYERNEH